MHPQQAAVDFQTAAISASVPMPYQQIDYGMDMMLSGAAVSVYDPSGMQMNPQTFLSGTQYPSVTLGSVHMYATPTTQYMPAQTTHYNANSHHHQANPGSQVPPPPPPSVPNQYTNSPQAYPSPQIGQQAPQGQTPAYVPVSSGYGPEQMSAMVLPMNPAQPPLQIAMTQQPYHHEQPMQPQTPSNTPRPATSGTESGGGTPTSVNPANPLNLSNEELKLSLTRQLEYYFSRENLARDAYLNSQMDPDQFVDIATIANFNQVKRLTNDINLVTLVLKESGNVQVDLQGKKVRPNHARSTVILREIPNNTSREEIENLFKSDKCPKFVHIDPPCSNMWYVNFETERDALAAFDYLREEVKTFKDQPIMARIKARSMNRVSASSGTSSQPPATPTGLVSPVASAPGTPGVAPGGIAMGIPQQPVLQGVPTTSGVSNSTGKNGYPRQQQSQQPQQQPQHPPPSQTPQQQPTIMPYSLMPQQAAMVPAQGPAQPMQPGNGQQPNMAAMTPTSMAPSSYPYVGTTNASQPMHGGQLLYMPQQQFYPPSLSLYYQNFPTFTQNVIPVESQMFQQPQYKPTGPNRAGGNGSGTHPSYTKPRRGRGGGTISGDRINNDQRYQNQSAYQTFGAPGGNGVQSNPQQPPYNSYNYGRVSTRSSWDGNASKKGPQGTLSNDQPGQQIASSSNGPVPVSSPSLTPSSLAQPTLVQPVPNPIQASSQPSQINAREPVEAASTQQQQTTSPTTTPPSGPVSNQVDSPDEALPLQAVSPAAVVLPSTSVTAGATTQSSYTRGGDIKSSRNNDESSLGSGGGYQSQQGSGYGYNTKSSMESLHGKDQSRRGKGRGGIGTRGGRSDEIPPRDMSSGRGGYAGGRGSYHSGGGYRAQNVAGTSGNLGTSTDQGGHQHHLSQSSSGATGLPPGSSTAVVNPPAKTPPVPEFEMKGNDFPALPGVPTTHSEVRKVNDTSESGSSAWGGGEARFLDAVKRKPKLTSSNSSSTSSRKDPAEDQETELDCVISERVTVIAASQNAESKVSEMQSSSTKTASPSTAGSSVKANVTAAKSDETNSLTTAPPLVNGDVKSSVSSAVSVNTVVATTEVGSGLASPGNGQKSNDGKLSYAQMAQKKKEKEERGAAEKAALAAANANQEQTDVTKKIVKDSAVSKKLHGVNSKDIDNLKCSNVINSASGATTITTPTSSDRNPASNESTPKPTQNTFQRSKQGASKDSGGSAPSVSSGVNSGPDSRKSGGSSVGGGGGGGGGNSGQQRHPGGASNSKKPLSGTKSATTPTSTGAVLSSNSSSQPESVGTSK